MNKKMRELLAKHEAKVKEAKTFMEGDEKDLEAFGKAMDEADAIMEEYNAEKRIFEAEKANVAVPTEPKEPEDPAERGQEEQVDSVKAFAEAARTGFKNEKLMNESSEEDGGYTVPEDIQTRIEKYRDAEFSLLEMVDVESVTTNKGARTFQKRSDTDGFAEVDENGSIPEISAPKFERISYNIKEYAGFLPVTNQLLEDSPENITNTITEWMGKNSRATANRLILAKLKEKDAIEIDGIKGIKGVLNKKLGQAFKPTSAIITNDDGLDYLDNLEDKNGRPLLNPDPTDSAKIQLRSGATIVPVKVLPNKTLKTEGTKVPFIIGDLHEAIKYWDRKKMSMLSSNAAAVGNVNAFANNLTLFRAIEREDVTLKDAEAYVMCYIETAEEPNTGETTDDKGDNAQGE